MNPELAMTGLVILLLVFCFAIIWFVFLVPMEQGLHKRRMQLIRKKLEQNEERLRREREAAAEASRGEERRRAGGER